MRILSGLTPTSAGIHLGNYFGAVRQWIELQEKNEAFYFVATYHAMTSLKDPKDLRQNQLEVALDYLALGLDPDKATLYLQQDIPEVTELTWILSTLTPMGTLERCHAYKDKVAKGLSADHALFAYPVLMAADILIVKSEGVPVGQDQKQHVEVTRDLAMKFNQAFGEVFPLPEPLILEGAGGKVPGIDGEKMSKSYGNVINIFDPEKKVRKQVMAIVTDTCGVDDEKEPEGNTIYELFQLCATPEQVTAMADKFRSENIGYGYGHAKQELFEALMDEFGPARKRREELAGNLGEVEEILRAGAAKVRPLVEETMDAVRKATGLR